MADAAARREARRQRILENSENRLRRITGRISENHVEEKGTLPEPSVPKRNENNVSTEEITRELINTGSEGSRLPQYELNETHEHTMLSSYQQTLLLGQNLRNNLDIGGLNERLSPTIQDFNSSNSDENLRQFSFPTKPSHTYSVLFNDISYLLLALIVNILCLLNLDYLFGTTIMIPYFAVTVAHLLFPGNWIEPQGSGLIVAALILCNINPKLIHGIRKIATVCNKIFRGFALYIFSFVMIRWVLSQVWIELDISPSKDLMGEVHFNFTI